MNLQYGVPLDVLCEKLVNTRFEPMGMTSNKEIPMVKSIMDYLVAGSLSSSPNQRKPSVTTIRISSIARTRRAPRVKDAFAMRLPVVDEGTVAIDMTSQC